MNRAQPVTADAVEIDLLLEGVYRTYGHDFRGWERAPLAPRIAELVRAHGLRSVSALQELLLRDEAWLELLVDATSRTTATLFDEPDLYGALRTRVVPLLRTYPTARIWVAACSHGPALQALVIVLHEEGLASRCQIWATDASSAAVAAARSGVLPAAELRAAEAGYRNAGGRGTLWDHAVVEGDAAVLHPALLEGVVFARHSLVGDEVFNEFHLVLCATALSSYGQVLRRRALDLLHRSLASFGVLALGSGGTLQGSGLEGHYRLLDGRVGLHRRIA